MVSELTNLKQIKQLSDRLIPFLDELREVGFTFGVGEYLRVHSLLIRLSAMGMLENGVDQLADYLAPLIATNQEELEEIHTRYAIWIGEQQPAPAPETSQLADEVIQTGKIGSSWLWGIGALLLTLLVAFLLLLGQGVLLNTDTGGIKNSNEYVATTLLQPSFYFVTILSGFSLLTIIWQLWWRQQAKMFLNRHPTKKQPVLKTLTVHTSHNLLFRSLNFTKTAQDMRKRYKVDSRSLDINASLKKTVENCGVMIEVPATRLLIPEYLLLIDRSTVLDHSSRYIDVLADRLQEENVFCHRYYFYQDPRLCFTDTNNEESLELKRLAVQYEGYRLLIFSDGKGLVNRLTRTAEPWLDIFDHWPDRALMPLGAISNRLKIDTTLHEAGFQVLQAGEKGLSLFIQNIQDNHTPTKDSQIFGGQLPELLKGDLGIWLNSETPPPPTLAELDEQLLNFLGSDGFDWFICCAVYPQILFDLTLFLGQNLQNTKGEVLYTEETFKLLAQLPWFRDGRMPAWLRKHLLKKMDRIREEKIRNLLRALLLTSLDHNQKGFKLTYAAVQQQELGTFHQHIFERLRKKSHRQGPLQDYIFVDFMKNSLSVRIPRKIAHLFKQTSEKTTNLPGFAFDKDIFLRPKPLTLIAFTLVSLIVSLPQVYLDSISFNLRPLQYILTMVTGYRYGPRIGILCGGMFFLPNLLLFPYEKTIEDFIHAPWTTGELNLISLSPLSYFCHIIIGWGAAILRSLFPNPPVKRLVGKWVYFLWLPILLTSFSIKPTDTLIVYMNMLVVPILFLTAFHIGYKQTVYLLAGYLPLCFFQFSPDMMPFGGISGVDLVIFSATLFLVANLPRTAALRLGWRSILYMGMMVLTLLSAFTYEVNDELHLPGYAISIGLIVCAGALFGSRHGLRFGLIWATITGLYLTAPSDLIRLGATSWSLNITAPLIGYWAGMLPFTSFSKLIAPLLNIISAYYITTLFAKLLHDSTHLPGYYTLFLAWLGSIVTSLILLFILQKFRIENIPANEIRFTSTKLRPSENVFWEIVIHEQFNCCNMLVKELELSDKVNMVSIKRGEKILIPRGGSKIMAEDVLTFFGENEDIKKLNMYLESGHGNHQ